MDQSQPKLRTSLDHSLEVRADHDDRLHQASNDGDPSRTELIRPHESSPQQEHESDRNLVQPDRLLLMAAEEEEARGGPLRSFAARWIIPSQVASDVGRTIVSARSGDSLRAFRAAIDTSVGLLTGYCAVRLGLRHPGAWALGAGYFSIGGFEGMSRGYGRIAEFIIQSGPNRGRY